MVSIGIDLGTSNTVVAKVNDKGEVSIHQFEGNDLLPSIIHVEGDSGHRIVGRRARDVWADLDADPSETFRRWKMSMATGAVLVTQDWGDGPRTITPEWLTTWLVEHIMKKITQDLGGETVDSVVVTVPHGWRREHVEKCLATRDAARAAQADGQSRRKGRNEHALGYKVADRTVDEPVAAAAYALYASDAAATFVGKNMLIVDIGGGTTDLSLVRVGEPGEPLTVIDAVNNDIGGDYATALLLRKHLETVSSQIGIDVPLTPEAVLADLEGTEKGWLREAFAKAETELLHTLSARLETIEELEDFTEKLAGKWGRRLIVMSSTVDDDTVVTSMSCSEYLTRLEPFFESTRALLTRFLSRGAGSEQLPHAILMTGGGSRIGALRSQVIEPVIRELAGPTEASEILGRLDRLRFNDSRLSTAVAMGAALVAAGKISIEERLLWDVGLEIRVTEKMARHLGLDDSCRCVISPLLTKGASLPATVSLKEFGFGKLDIEPNDQFIQRIVVFDDLRSPYDRTWERELSGSGDALKDVEVTLTADTEGMLRLVVNGSAGGKLIDIQGQLHRPRRTQTGGLGIRDEAHSALKIRTPQQIIESKTASGSGAGSSAVRIRTSTTHPGR
jgi:possible heat shock protein